MYYVLTHKGWTHPEVAVAYFDDGTLNEDNEEDRQEERLNSFPTTASLP